MALVIANVISSGMGTVQMLVMCLVLLMIYVPLSPPILRIRGGVSCG